MIGVLVKMLICGIILRVILSVIRHVKLLDNKNSCLDNKNFSSEKCLLANLILTGKFEM